MRIPLLVLLIVALSPSASAQVTVQLPIGIRVEVAPPQLRVEVPPPAPSPAQVWVAGYWSYGSGHYVWIPGSYVVAPQPNARWVPARWVNRGDGWYFEPGRWAAVPNAPPPQPAYQQPAPAAYPPPAPTYQPPPPPMRQPPPPRRLSRDEAARRAFEIASQHGVRPESVREVESDDNAWKVKLILAGGGKAKVQIDPWTGAEMKFEAKEGCRPNQYWDGEECRHKGKGHGARKHDDD